MAKYVSILNSDLGLSYWKAVQWDNSLESIKNNEYYNSDFNQQFPKDHNHTIIEEKIITEVKTLASGTATVIKLSKTSTNYLKLANNKASKSFLKNIQS